MVHADADVQVGQPSVSFGAEGEVMDMTEARWAVIAAPRRQYGTCGVETGDFAGIPHNARQRSAPGTLTGFFRELRSQQTFRPS